jgi:nucleotide-binding universal stress UspA family protein
MEERAYPMTQRLEPVSLYAQSVEYSPHTLLVAEDFSPAADSALKYAVMLAKRFGSHIHLISVQTPIDFAEALEGGSYAIKTSEENARTSLARIQAQLKESGIESDATRRVGNASDTLWKYAAELKPDLLLFGAYGYSPSDRPGLGSTAEHLLRTVRCPAFVVGPHANVSKLEIPSLDRILCATTSLESPDKIVDFSAHFAKKMQSDLEFLHVVDPIHRGQLRQRYEEWCENWCRKLRRRNISASWTLLYGQPEEAIAKRAAEAKVSLIIFGLHRSGSHMIDCPDGVVSSTIHQASCPIMTVPMESPS